LPRCLQKGVLQAWPCPDFITAYSEKRAKTAMENQYGKQCPQCENHRTKIIDLEGDGDNLIITLECDICGQVFAADEGKSEPEEDQPWWIDLEGDFARHFAAYLARFSGD
jgi:hypothetical protein